MQTKKNSSAADRKDVALLFTSDLIEALLKGTKTQTRRIINPQPVLEDGIWMWKRKGETPIPLVNQSLSMLAESRYQVGDRLYAKESMYLDKDDLGEGDCWYYDLDKKKVMVSREDEGAMLAWAHHKQTTTQSALFMPRWAARTWREIAEVSVQRIGDISEEDAIAEGIVPLIYRASAEGHYARYYHYEYQTYHTTYDGDGARQSFRTLWNQINGKWTAIRKNMDGGETKKKELSHYISYPWNEEDIKDKPDVRNKDIPFLACPNPWVWAIKFTTVLRDEGK